MHVRGHENVLKRLLMHAGAFNLRLWMRTLIGVGSPRGLQGRLAPFGALLTALCASIYETLTPPWAWPRNSARPRRIFDGLVIAEALF
jgi:transposase